MEKKKTKAINIEAYNISPIDFERIGRLPFFDIYFRAYNLLQDTTMNLYIRQPAAFYYQVALWQLLYLFQHRDNLKKDDDFFHNYFEIAKNKGAIHDEYEVILVNCMVYQIAFLEEEKNPIFFIRIRNEIDKIIKWCFDKFPNTEAIWYALAGKPYSIKNCHATQNVCDVINNFYGQTTINEINDNENLTIIQNEKS